MDDDSERQHNRKAAKYRFNSYEEVKILIYEAYSKRMVKAKAQPKKEERK